MSLLYSGTGALKTDFTLTGKRTTQGALEDGKRAIMRYYINNVNDTYNQNSLDFLLGNVTLEQTEADVSNQAMSIPMTLLIVIILFLIEK